MTANPPERDAARLDTGALALGIGTYLLWGFFPLYFHLLDPAGPLEIVVHRAVWALLIGLVALLAMRRLGSLATVLRDTEAVARLAAAGLLIVVNWVAYIYAVQSGHTTDAALGYFINPLVTVALGMVVLRERISGAQKVAVGLGAAAVIVLLVAEGRVPWVSLVLALTFGLYSLVKKRVASRVDPLAGMVVETGAVTPLLIGYYVWLLATGTTSFSQLASGASGPAWGWHIALLAGAGVLTLVPLVMFATAARGLPLGVMGLLQYITPVMQLLIGVFVFHEHISPARWAGTAVVWVALVILSFDWIVQARRLRRFA